MCKTCNDTGGINITHSWGIHFAPCPNTNCDFDKEGAIKKTQATLERLKREMNLYEPC